MKKSTLTMFAFFTGGLLTAMMLWVYFSNPHSDSTKSERMISDTYLNALVRSNITYGAVNILFGPPVFERQIGELIEAHYAMGTKDPTFQTRNGRVGFTALYRDGTIIKWTEVTQKVK